MDRSSRTAVRNVETDVAIPGDPGVGGLLSDPLKPSRVHDTPDPSAGPPSPAPAPPRHHGDWMLPRKATDLWAASARLASITRRKSRNGMPRALFRENDGSTLDDLRELAIGELARDSDAGSGGRMAAAAYTARLSATGQTKS